MIKNIVFDIGNVLVEFSYRAYFESFNFSQDVTERIIKATVQGPYWNEIDRGLWTYEEILQKFISVDPEIEEQLKAVFENFDGLLNQFGYTKGMIISLKQRGYRVYCLSNMSHKAVNECGEALNFLTLLDGYVLSCDVKKIKPEVEIYETFLDKYKLKAEECVFIDDLEANIEAAKVCGMHGIVFKDLKSMTAELEELVKTEASNGSSYSKGQRIAALACVVLIALMYLVTLVFALMKGEFASTMFKISLGCTIVLPVLAWVYIWIIGKLTHKRTIADFRFFED